MAPKRRYTFSEKKSSSGGKRALILSAASAGVFAAAVLISAAFGGNAGPFLGAVTAFGTLLSVYGFYSGMKSFSEEDVSATLSILGSVLSGVIMVGYLTLFMSGLR